MKNWLIPPEIYDELDKEFHFDFDPCPYPKQEWDGLFVEWGNTNWVNPPFKKEDGGPATKWIRKAIQQHRKGKTVVLIYPQDRWLRLLYEEGVEVRCLGDHDWISGVDGSRHRSSRPSFLFILK